MSRSIKAKEEANERRVERLGLTPGEKAALASLRKYRLAQCGDIAAENQRALITKP